METAVTLETKKCYNKQDGTYLGHFENSNSFRADGGSVSEYRYQFEKGEVDGVYLDEHNRGTSIVNGKAIISSDRVVIVECMPEPPKVPKSTGWWPFGGGTRHKRVTHRNKSKVSKCLSRKSSRKGRRKN